MLALSLLFTHMLVRMLVFTHKCRLKNVGTFEAFYYRFGLSLIFTDEAGLTDVST